MDVDSHGLCHLAQIRRIAIGSEHLPVDTFPPDVQLSGDLITHDPDHRSAIDEHEKFVAMNHSENSWRSLAVPDICASIVIFHTGEGRKVNDSNFLWCSQGPGSNSFVLGH